MTAGSRWRRMALGAAFFLGAIFLALPPAVSFAASPVEPSVPVEIGRFFQAGHYDQAVEALHAAIEKTPQDAALYYWLGRS